MIIVTGRRLTDLVFNVFLIRVLFAIHRSKGATVDFDPNAVQCSINPCQNEGTCINMLAHGYVNPVTCHGSSCYEFVRTSRTWQDANVACMTMSASLVSMETETEMDVIKSYIIANELYGSTDQKTTGFWTGGNDIAREGIWVWTGTDRIITSWDASTYSTAPGTNARVQNCLELNTQYLEDQDFRWRASRCSVQKYFICEFSTQQIIEERTYECLCPPGFGGYHCENRQPDAISFTLNACDNDLMTLQCSSDVTGDAALSTKQIHVISAQYGRWMPGHAGCPSTDLDINVYDCKFNSSRAKYALGVHCEGRQECAIMVSRPVMGYQVDVCPRASKYVQVVYECREPHTLPTVECERDGGQDISCEMYRERSKIFIEYANYGRLSKHVCSSVQGVDTNECRSITSLAVVSEWCNGKTTCSLAADNHYFGDPCTAAYKYLEVRYRCVAQAPNVNWYPDPVGIPVNEVPEYCESVSLGETTWPRTREGQTAAALCPEGKEGIVYWTCQDDPVGWDSEGPDYSRCISAWVNRANEMIESRAPATDIATALQEETTTEEFMTTRDIEETVVIVDDLLQLQSIQLIGLNDEEKESVTKNFTEEIVAVGSNLLNSQNIKQWNKMSSDYASVSATSLVDSMEKSAHMLANQMTGAEEMRITKENIVMEAIRIEKTGPEGPVRPLSFEVGGAVSSGNATAKGGITLPSFILEPTFNNNTDPVKVAFLAYQNIGNLLKSANTSVDGSVESDYIANSVVIAASVNGGKYTEMDSNVIFILDHLKTDGVENPICAFWNYSESNMKGAWSDYGCNVVTSNATTTVCACNHLTNFAVLMDVHGTKLSDDHTLALSVITYIGCIISIVCLFICIIVFTSFRPLWCVRNTIHRNLCLCLLVAEVTFLVGIDRTQNQTLCAVFAGLMHYFFLAAFAWMCLEGVQLYIMLVLVFAQEKSRIYLYYITGYGVPAIIVGISAAIKHDGYGTSFHCWLTTEFGFIWSFVGPVIAITVVNLVFLFMALRVAYAHRSVTAKQEKGAAVKVRKWAKGAVVLVCILGVTWILGLLYVDGNSVVMAYTFTLMNTFQGTYIFVFHCLCNEKVQKEIGKRLRRSRLVPSYIRNKYLQHLQQSSGAQAQSTASQGVRQSESSNCIISAVSESVQMPESDVKAPNRADSYVRGNKGQYTLS